jgi:CheY-like chemotaxis protein
MAQKTIAIMNTSKEITDLLTEVFKEEGYYTYSLFTYLFKKNQVDFDTYITSHLPDVILYDIGLPYKENYELFKKLRTRPVVRDIPFVLTTTNKDALEKFIGKTHIYELIGKPYDLKEIVEAVSKALLKQVDTPTLPDTKTESATT